MSESFGFGTLLPCLLVKLAQQFIALGQFGSELLLQLCLLVQGCEGCGERIRVTMRRLWLGGYQQVIAITVDPHTGASEGIGEHPVDEGSSLAHARCFRQWWCSFRRRLLLLRALLVCCRTDLLQALNLSLPHAQRGRPVASKSGEQQVIAARHIYMA